MKKKSLWALSMILLLCLFVVFGAGAEKKTIVARGTCGAQGDNLTWTLDSAGTLTISGEGEMKDYNSTEAPWKKVAGNIKNIIVKEGVTHIGYAAFTECKALINVNFPSSLMSIGDKAFSNCDLLENAKIPAGLTQMGTFAFPSITKLSAGFATDAAKTISKNSDRFWNGDVAYRYKYEGDSITGLNVDICDPQATSVVIPDGVTSIGNSAFAFCRELTSVSIPSSVTSIGEWAFRHCYELISVNIPEGVTNIGEGAFSHCSELTSVNIPEGVTNIEGYTFSDCNALTNVGIPASVTSIGERAFAGCSLLTSVTLPEHITSIGSSAFPASTRCNARFGTDTAKALSKSGHSFGNGDVMYRYEYDGDSEIGLCVVDCDLQATAVVIPDGVTSIGDSAFSGCSVLASVSIPSGVTSIGNSAFSGCSVLASVSIPSGVTSIGNSAFSDCSVLASVSIPSGVTSIGDSAFYCCSMLTSVSIPEGVISVGNSAFYRCRSLTSVGIPESVTSIGSSAFSGCSMLASAKIPSGVTSLSPNTFWACSALTSVSIPEGVTSIGNSAFMSCKNLKAIDIPDTVTSIGQSAFSGCSELTDATLSKSLEVIPKSMFYGCKKLKSITIPQGVTTIENYAFYDTDISSFDLPEGITTLGNKALGTSSICRLVLPSTIQSIGSNLIQSSKGNSSKASIICYATEGPTTMPDDWMSSTPQVVYCWELSPMEIYAKENGYNVVLLDDLVDKNGNIDWSRDTSIKTLSVQETCDMRVGTQRALDWSIFPGTNRMVEMTSSAPEVVSIENGVLAAHKPGNATITVTVDGLTASCEVTAYEQVTELAFADVTLFLPVKYTTALPLTYAPEGSNETLLWSSSNENVATVADGVLMTKALGNADIIVTTKHSGLSAICTVMVTDAVTAVKFAAAEVKAVVGDKVRLPVNVTTGTSKYQNELVSYTSSAPEIVQVDCCGTVTLLASGTADITAVAMGNESITASCTVTAVAENSKQMKLPAKLTAVESKAFSNTAAEVVIIPEGCTSIGSRAFANSRVGRVTIPASVTNIVADAFVRCTVTISAPEDSFAMSWAKEHGVPYIVE